MNFKLKLEASPQAPAVALNSSMADGYQAEVSKGKIWVDLENSPHVPFFAPIMDELRKCGYSLLVTARDCFQVRELADLFHLSYKLVGHHPGKSNIRKLAGLCTRGLKLVPLMWREKPDLAVSHGSRSQLIACSSLRIPSLIIRDYEYSTPLPWLTPSWVMCPEVVPTATLQCDPRRVLKYPGIKEDVYIRRFVPDSNIRLQLGLGANDVVATLRPAASEAHYYKPQTDQLFDAAVKFLSESSEVKLVVLPRNEKQAIELKKRWPGLFANGVMRIPEHVVDGLNLIWFSDLVVSGGGTMNREAAALGVPVYSVFRGKIGAVDQYLAHRGRLVLLASVEDVQAKLVIKRRNRPQNPEIGDGAALRTILAHIVSIMDAKLSSSGTSRAAVLNNPVTAGWRDSGRFHGSETTK